MKFGFRVPSFKKRFAARTSWKRVVRHSLGFKAPRGWGWFTNPRKAAYNRVYNRTSFDIFKTLGRAFSGGKRAPSRHSLLPSLFGLVQAFFAVGILIIGALLFFGIISSFVSSKSTSTPEQFPNPSHPVATAPGISKPPVTIATTTPPQLNSMPFATAAEAQQAAVRRYPGLGVAGSTLNTAFVTRYKQYQKQRPEYFSDSSWPMRLAEEIVRIQNTK
jgi:hypothetical protein